MTNDGGDRYISGQYDSDSQTCTLTYVDITHHRFGGETLDSTESEPITIENQQRSLCCAAGIQLNDEGLL